VANLVKKYYTSRNQMVRWGISTAVAVVGMAILMAGGKWQAAFWGLVVFFGAFIPAVIQFHNGLKKWGDADSDLKALGYRKPPLRDDHVSEGTLSARIETPEKRIIREPLISVTESTTQLLDQKRE
jgi:hypothetical protein